VIFFLNTKPDINFVSSSVPPNYLTILILSKLQSLFAETFKTASTINGDKYSE